VSDSARLDEALSSPVRLRIAAYLAGCQEADFAAVQTYCEMTPSSLSKQVTALSAVGYVEVHKVASGRYSKTRLALTRGGRGALSAHIAWLRNIVEQSTAIGYENVDAASVEDT
jgi:DNA-binding MarR family transcriptional regulator